LRTNAADSLNPPDVLLPTDGTSLSEMQETRHQFHESLIELEQQTLGGLDMVLQQLDRALESVTNQDVELAEMVIADDDGIDAS
jgi:phosphate uptake regulator